MIEAPTWRREPYRLLFPLGVLLAWAGLFHWVLFALGVTAEFKSIFHSIAQIQGFMMSFAVGFLFTAIPRRTGTDAPAAWEMGVAIAAPVATTVAAWFGRFEWSQLPWLVLVVTLVAFAVRRFRSSTATRRPPSSFVWIPFGMLVGICGVVAFLLYGMLGADREWLHSLGQLMLLQGVFLSLVIGVGGMALPLICHGDSSTDGDAAGRLRNLVLAVLLLATFALEVAGWARLGLASRGVLVLAVLLVQSKIHRAPTRPGLHRGFVWMSAWAVPVGFLVAALLYPNVQPGLHVTFVAGFGLMALSVGLHVTFAHGGRQDLVFGRLWQVAVFGVLVLFATVLRTMVNLDPANRNLWIGVSAGVFLIGTCFWLWLVVVTMGRPADHEG